MASHMEMIRLLVMTSLADLVNEEEAELLKANTNMFSFIIKKIKKALKKSDHKDAGWSVEELLRGLFFIY